MVSRREFLKSMAVAGAGVAMSPVASAFGANPFAKDKKGTKKEAVKDKVKIAYVGIGNRGNQIIKEFEKTGMTEVVALCDVDLDGKQCNQVRGMFPNAKLYTDFRKMFDEISNEFEAVAIATPDHSHFPISMRALKEGKHVFVEKPLACTFLECQLLMDAAKKRPHLATQVGNQGHSEANYFQFKAWKEAGIIKDVTAVTAHMNNPRRWHGWDSNIKQMPAAMPLPANMNWDAWLGTRPWHDFNKDYHQGQWRCWYDFGMGCLGDWGAHIIDTIHEFLELGLPYEVKMLKATEWNEFFYPYSSTILFRFPARNGMPPVDITWYDGVDNLPPLPEGYGESIPNANIPSTNQGATPTARLNPGKEIYTKDLIFKGGSHDATLEIINKEKAAGLVFPEVPETPSNHYKNFLNACLGLEKTRSPFEINGVLSQVFSLGVVAQRLNADIFFDSRTKEVTNNPFANALLAGTPPRRGWEEYYKD